MRRTDEAKGDWEARKCGCVMLFFFNPTTTRFFCKNQSPSHSPDFYSTHSSIWIKSVSVQTSCVADNTFGFKSCRPSGLLEVCHICRYGFKNHL
jgi:hypothetical protein